MAEVFERSRQIGAAIDEATGRFRDRVNGHSPLLVSEANLRAAAAAIRDGGSYGAVEELETRPR
jgi:hypothetical protein